MKIVSSLSTVAVAASIATPAFAYISNNNDATLPGVSHATDTSRAITSRQVVRNLRKAPILGERNRSTAIADDSGRILLPVRNTWRHAGLRNSNRHLLGNQRGGAWKNARQYMQGDMRRSSQVTASAELLPPTIVETGANAGRPSRRAIRGHRNLNNYNRR